MAGILPGVGVPQRRKTNKQHRQESPFNRGEIPLSDRREPLITTVSSLDETALRARQRLEQKLVYMCLSPRSCELVPCRSNGCNHKSGKADAHLASKIIREAMELKTQKM